MTDNSNVTETLETLIDKHGLLAVLTGLECVCDEKADHIRHTWQDKRTAGPWARMARQLYNVARVCAESAI